MREIKFRGKTLNGDWVEGAYFVMRHDDERKHTHHFIIPDGTPIPKDKPIGDIQVEVRDFTIGQFIGIKDSKGREIYEGDILEYYNEITQKSHLSGLVIYNEHAAAFNVVNPENGHYLYIKPTDDGIDKTLTIIGNIHDNPELMEAK